MCYFKRFEHIHQVLATLRGIFKIFTQLRIELIVINIAIEPILALVQIGGAKQLLLVSGQEDDLFTSKRHGTVLICSLK